MVDLGSEGGQAGAVEHASGCVPDFLHGQMYPADRLVPAVGAALVGRLAGARYRGQGPVEHPDHLSQVDVSGVPGQEVASSFTLPAAEKPLVPETEKNQLEKLGRDLLRTGQIRDSHWLLGIGFGQGKKGLDGVFGFFGEHVF